MSEIKLEEVSKEELKNFESLQSFKSEIEKNVVRCDVIGVIINKNTRKIYVQKN